MEKKYKQTCKDEKNFFTLTEKFTPIQGKVLFENLRDKKKKASHNVSKQKSKLLSINIIPIIIAKKQVI